MVSGEDFRRLVDENLSVFPRVSYVVLHLVEVHVWGSTVDIDNGQERFSIGTIMCLNFSFKSSVHQDTFNAFSFRSYCLTSCRVKSICLNLGLKLLMIVVAFSAAPSSRFSIARFLK